MSAKNDWAGAATDISIAAIVIVFMFLAFKACDKLAERKHELDKQKLELKEGK